jgi:hypothetical protein
MCCCESLRAISDSSVPVRAEKQQSVDTTRSAAHGNVKSYLYRFKITQTLKCRCGNKDQTIDHPLIECELLKKERDSLISAYQSQTAGQQAKIL